ncbi:MAG: hypothetical protein Q7U87_02795, partial [bacterium]|nr:hypothetical protein [bacterium]
MNYTKNIFTPKVILPIKILQGLLGFVFLYFIIAQVQRHNFDFKLSVALFGMFLFSFWVYILLPQKIIFSNNIIIDWWIWPKTVVKYGDITDIVVYEFNEYGTIQIFRKNRKI